MEGREMHTKFLPENPKRQFWKLGCRWDDKIDLKEIRV